MCKFLFVRHILVLHYAPLVALGPPGGFPVSSLYVLQDIIKGLPVKHLIQFPTPHPSAPGPTGYSDLYRRHKYSTLHALPH